MLLQAVQSFSINNAEVIQQGFVLIAAGGTMRTTSGDTADTVLENLTSSGTFNVAAHSTAIVDDNWAEFRRGEYAMAPRPAPPR